MSLHWQLPATFQSAGTHTIIGDALQWLGTVVSEPLRDTSFEYWFLSHEGRAPTVIVLLMGLSLTWTMVLRFSSCHNIAPPNHAVPALLLDEEDAGVKELQALMTALTVASDDASALFISSSQSEVEGATPKRSGKFVFLMKKLAPTGHRPVNANLVVPQPRTIRQLALLSSSTPARLILQSRIFRTPTFSVVKEVPIMHHQLAMSSSCLVDSRCTLLQR
jgi:hypothetical protein